MSSLCKIPTDEEIHAFSIFEYFVCKTLYILLDSISPNNYNLDKSETTSSAMVHYIWHLHAKLWQELCKLSHRELFKKFKKLYKSDVEFICSNMQDSDFKNMYFILRTLKYTKYYKLVLKYHCPAIDFNALNIRICIINKKMLVIV